MPKWLFPVTSKHTEHGNEQKAFPIDEAIMGHPKDKTQDPEQGPDGRLGYSQQRGRNHSLPGTSAKPQPGS